MQQRISSLLLPFDANDVGKVQDAVERASAPIEITRQRKFYFQVAHCIPANHDQIKWKCLSIDVSGPANWPLRRYWTWEELRKLIMNKVSSRQMNRSVVLGIQWEEFKKRELEFRNSSWRHIAQNVCMFPRDLIWPNSKIVLVTLPSEMEKMMFSSRNLIDETKVAEVAEAKMPCQREFEDSGEAPWCDADVEMWKRDVISSIEHANRYISSNCSRMALAKSLS